MKRIPLTQGREAIVDDEDYSLVSGFKWHVAMQGARRDTPYACGLVSGKVVRMQRFIVGLKACKGLVVDHANRDTLDNRRANLRICSPADNVHNSKAIVGSSEFKGVHRSKTSGEFVAGIKHPKQTRLGTFTDEKAAAMAYDRAAIEAWGEYAWTNFPESALSADFVEKHRIIRKIGAMPPNAASTTGYKGVTFHRASRKYRAYVNAEKGRGGQIGLGYYGTAKEAARVHDGASRLLSHGRGYLNFPEEVENIGIPARLTTMPNIDPEEWYRVLESSALLNRSKPSILLLIAQGRLRAERDPDHDGRGRTPYRIKGRDLMKLAQKDVDAYEEKLAALGL